MQPGEPASPEGAEPYDVEEQDLNLANMVSLEDIPTSTWLQLWCDHQVDRSMVLQKWGAQVMETFEVSRQMISMEQTGLTRNMWQTLTTVQMAKQKWLETEPVGASVAVWRSTNK